MATASSGSATLVNGKGSSFGVFRFPNPVNDNATTIHHSNATSDQQQHQARDQMAQAAQSSLGQTIDRTAAFAPPGPGLQNHNHLHPAQPVPSGLELVELALNPIIEGVLGPNKDGRVRNPVPSKLKGKTDNKQGNFGVMHMGMSPAGKRPDAQGNREAAAERDAAARRTSEAVNSRAKAAQVGKYVPPKKRMLDSMDPANHSPFGVPRGDPRQSSRPLAPDETKFEQARLLTLLRTIQPIMVVDQICTAVAYFGGIPGAPPPEDGIFPESAITRETGALFIGWLAEIFPNRSQNPEMAVKQELRKGKKKAKQSAGSTGTFAVDAANEAPNSRNGYGYGPAIAAPTWGLPQSLGLAEIPAPAAPIPLLGEAPAATPISDQKPQVERSNMATPIRPQADESSSEMTSTNKRRRGRPKGSTNKKGKNDNGAGHGDIQHGHADGRASTSAAAQPDQPEAPTDNYNQQAAIPKGAKLIYLEQSWPTSIQQEAPNSNSNIADILSPEERAVLEAFRNQGQVVMSVQPTSVQPSQTVPAKEAQKRKRAPPIPKPIPSIPTAYPGTGGTTRETPILPPTKDISMNIAKDALQWDTNSTAAAPRPKKPRVRKPKAPSVAEPVAQTQNAPVVNIATLATQASTIPDSQAGSSQQSITMSRPLADGLEAQYERFANLQNQQNGGSQTPTYIQQHSRQTSKPLSIPSQNNTPLLQQQQLQAAHQQAQSQIQQPQSQQPSQSQSSQRDDSQKITPSNSGRSATSTFYNQQSRQPSSSAIYAQQYPSHQPSQLYGGHSATPNLNTNNYRTPSTQSMVQSQTATQYSTQADNSYRTTSPHISQASPSFSQADNSYRTSSTHSLVAGPSPAYAQTSNTYRTPSANSVAQSATSYAGQPATSYSTSRSQGAHSGQAQPHTSHYGNFGDSPYIDLPTLESLGHANTASNTGVGMPSGMNSNAYGLSLGSGVGPAPRTSSIGGNVYGNNAGLSGAYGNLERTTNPSGGGYSSAFDTGGAEAEMRERLLRGSGRR